MVMIDCKKCCGTGEVQYKHVLGGRCFKCNGTGKVVKTKRIKTTEIRFIVTPPPCFNKEFKETYNTIEKANESIANWNNFLLPEETPATLEIKTVDVYSYIPV